jgi:hypothetical protein
MLETINWLSLTLPFIAAVGAYTKLQEKAVPIVLAAVAAAGVLVAIFFGYAFMYHSIGFPLWMRWFSAADAEPLPGRPEININTKLDADWTIVGMNYDWMVLVAKAHLQIGSHPEAYMRWEFAKSQETDDGKAYSSQVQWVELECKKGSWNPLVITSYASNNLSGAECTTVAATARTRSGIRPTRHPSLGLLSRRHANCLKGRLPGPISHQGFIDAFPMAKPAVTSIQAEGYSAMRFRASRGNQPSGKWLRRRRSNRQSNPPPPQAP